MVPSMPAMSRGLKDQLDGASAGAWRAVLTHPHHHQQPIRNSFCCGPAVLPNCAGNDMSHVGN